MTFWAKESVKRWSYPDRMTKLYPYMHLLSYYYIVLFQSWYFRNWIYRWPVRRCFWDPLQDVNGVRRPSCTSYDVSFLREGLQPPRHNLLTNWIKAAQSWGSWGPPLVYNKHRHSYLDLATLIDKAEPKRLAGNFVDSPPAFKEI